MMNYRRVWKGAILLVVMSAMLIPVAADAGGLKFGKLFKMSRSQELDIAKEMNAELAADPGLIEDGDYFEQVQRVGARLVERNGLEEYDYKFFLVDDEEVNAFATPAGYIYVTRGLLEYMAYDESMLAGVVAHELGHAKDRHVAKGYEKMIQGALGFTFLGIILGEKHRDVTDILFTGGQIVYLKYNRDQEEWADRAGVELNHAAGYDAYGMVRALQCLEELYGSAGEIAVWMANHPATDDRIARTTRIARDTCGKEHGYLPIPRLPEDHPLYEKYGQSSSVVSKTTSPVGSLE